jgi:hypothetical protein
VPAPVFEPALRRLGGRLGAGGLLDDGVWFLRYGRGVDNRRLHEDLGFEPAYDAVGAISDLARAAKGRRIGPDLHPGTLAGRLIGVSGE